MAIIYSSEKLGVQALPREKFLDDLEGISRP